MSKPGVIAGNRPRKAEQIFTVALRMLNERGYDGVTIEAVAAQAGVNKTTIYRWWSSKDDLLMAALLDSEMLTFAMPDTGTLRGDLIDLGENVARLVTGSRTTGIAAAIHAASLRRQKLAELARSFFADRLVREQPIFQRAIERGELAGDADAKTIMDLLDGAIWFRAIHRGEAIPPGHITTIVDAILNGVTPERHLHPHPSHF